MPLPRVGVRRRVRRVLEDPLSAFRCGPGFAPVLRELNHMIYVWYHAEGKAPDWRSRSRPTTRSGLVARSHLRDRGPGDLQDMAENNLDPSTSSTHKMKARRIPRSPEDTSSPHAAAASCRRHRSAPSTCSSCGRPTASASARSRAPASPASASTCSPRRVLSSQYDGLTLGAHDQQRGRRRGRGVDGQHYRRRLRRHADLGEQDPPREPVFCEADTLLVEFRWWAKQFYSPDQLAKPTPAS